MSHYETVYLQRDNSIKLGLTADGDAVDTRTLTRVVLKLTNEDDDTSTSYDSSTDPDVFDFLNEVAQVSDTTTGILVIKLQDASLPPSVGDNYRANLIVYDSQNPDGIYWDASFPVRVING
jgi:hypothetical protein